MKQSPVFGLLFFLLLKVIQAKYDILLCADYRQIVTLQCSQATGKLIIILDVEVIYSSPGQDCGSKSDNTGCEPSRLPRGNPFLQDVIGDCNLRVVCQANATNVFKSPNPLTDCNSDNLSTGFRVHYDCVNGPPIPTPDMPTDSTVDTSTPVIKLTEEPEVTSSIRLTSPVLLTTPVFNGTSRGHSTKPTTASYKYYSTSVKPSTTQNHSSLLTTNRPPANPTTVRPPTTLTTDRLHTSLTATNLNITTSLTILTTDGPRTDTSRNQNYLETYIYIIIACFIALLISVLLTVVIALVYNRMYTRKYDTANNEALTSI